MSIVYELCMNCALSINKKLNEEWILALLADIDKQIYNAETQLKQIRHPLVKAIASSLAREFGHKYDISVMTEYPGFAYELGGCMATSGPHTECVGVAYKRFLPGGDRYDPSVTVTSLAINSLTFNGVDIYYDLVDTMQSHVGGEGTIAKRNKAIGWTATGASSISSSKYAVNTMDEFVRVIKEDDIVSRICNRAFIGKYLEDEEVIRVQLTTQLNHNRDRFLSRLSWVSQWSKEYIATKVIEFHEFVLTNVDLEFPFDETKYTASIYAEIATLRKKREEIETIIF